MSSLLTATQVGFFLIALIQAVLAVVWGVGAYALTTARTAILHWVAWSALSACTWVMLSTNVAEPPMLAVAIGTLAVVLLQRGVRVFIGMRPPDRAHVLCLLVSVASSTQALSGEWRPLQAAINYSVIASLYLSTAFDLWRHARDRLRFDWPILLALPVLLGGVAFLLRVVRAIVEPESVTELMAADSAMNVRAAMIYVVLVLSLHSTLMVLVVARLVGELRRLSRHDVLTGLLNRRAMEEILGEQIQRCRSGRASFAVMMIDLDHFKRINDQYGHAVGDLALKHVAGLLGTALPPRAALARFGGEEFIVMLPASPLIQAGELAERLRDLLASNPLPHESTSIALSMSVGVAQWRSPSDDLSQLLRRADAALFQAKVQGRNRVVVSPETFAEPLPA